jgi:hypothetical protein
VSGSFQPLRHRSSDQGTLGSGGLINYNDPDYVSAGHFYALVKSVNVTCADPTPLGADITAYTYGANSSTNTPSVALTNATTDLNGAPGLQGRAGTGLQMILALAVAAGALGQLL